MISSRRDQMISGSFYALLSIVALLIILPFLLILAGSFTSESEIIKSGYTLFPRKLSLEGYDYLFKNFYWVLNGYKVSVIVTVLGTLVGLVSTAMIAYPTSRREMRYRNAIIMFCYFTMLFSGGIVPWYIVCTRLLGMKDNIWALILPICVGPWNIILLRNFFTTIPASLFESARLDGAGELRILFRIVLPLSTAGLATIGLFLIVMYWNDWWLGIMLINVHKLYPLQLLLRTIVSDIQFLQSAQSSQMQSSQGLLPSETVKMATTIVTIGPIILVYPFLQKYFIKGILIGAVKG